MQEGTGMDLSQLAPVLAEGSFGAGIGVGIGIGLGLGVAISSGGINPKTLKAAIEVGEISVVDKNGESMTTESIMELLKKQPKKRC